MVLSEADSPCPGRASGLKENGDIRPSSYMKGMKQKGGETAAAVKESSPVGCDLVSLMPKSRPGKGK